MTIATDFEIQNDKDIRYVGAAHGATGAGYYTVIEFHRWLQGLADDASATGDDNMDITRDTPSDRSTDNIITMLNSFNIDDTASEHLYGGSIIQAAGAEIYDGILVYANGNMDMQIQQNGALVANDFWNSIPFGTGLIGLNPDAANGISHRFMLKVRTGSADIDGRRLICQTRVWGKTFSEFKINGTSRGNNVAALTYADDLNNTTASVTVAGWATITNTEGLRSIDVDNNAVNESYYSEWNKDIYSINQFYERIKYLQRTGSVATLYGLNGEVFRGITHEVQLTTPRTGSFAATEAVSWGSGATAGTGRMLAIDNVSAGTKMWIQLLTGVAPSGSVTITGTSTATATNTGTPTERTLSFPACGVSTGSALIGAYGFGIEKLDLSANDKVFDLTNAMKQAPNYVTFTVSNLESGDYVIVAPSTGTVIDLAQMTLNGALTGAAVTSVVVSGSIPSDTPATGTIRILRANGFYTRHPYSAWSGSTFTISSHDFSSNNAAHGANTYISYIDGVSAGATMTFTGIYSTDRTLYVRVRNGAGTPKIKTYETATATLGSAGGSASASRISDE
jgi:hypothetical protein